MLDLSELLEQTRPTTIFVSHNIAQAAFLADKIVVLAGSPAKILGVVPVNSPKPRGPKVINGDKITSAAREVRKLLKGAAQ